jgi:hypothetical protein
MRVRSRKQYDAAPRIGTQNSSQHFVVIGMQLKQALRAEVQMVFSRSAQPRTPRTGARRLRSVVVRGQIVEQHEFFGILRLGAGRFEIGRREKVVDGRNAGGQRYAPGRALDGRQAGHRQAIGECLHADVGVKQHVELTFGNAFAGGDKMRGQEHDFVGPLVDESRH